jgi:hypothetical protein
LTLFDFRSISTIFGPPLIVFSAFGAAGSTTQSDPRRFATTL